MPNLETKYMNITFRNPILIASSGFSKTVEKIEACANAGAGGVILKSMFEEVLAQQEHGISLDYTSHPEAIEYYSAYSEMLYGSKEYCTMIREAKKRVEIPIIASINCVSAKRWPSFAEQVQAAGADGLELNVFTTPSDKSIPGEQVEKLYSEIVKEVKNSVSIPVAIKLGKYFSSLPYTVAELERGGVNGLVLFNRFTEPDIDVNTFRYKTTFHFSTQEELHLPLRWIAILYRGVKCGLCATTGIKTAEDVIKLLLAGASAVQVASLLYQQGLGAIGMLLDGLDSWMQKHHFETLAQFKGKLSFSQHAFADHYLRSQFIEKISDVE